MDKALSVKTVHLHMIAFCLTGGPCQSVGSLHLRHSTHLSGDVKLVHHFQFVVHLDAAFHKVQFTVIEVTEVKLEDLRFLSVWQDL